MRCSHIVKPTYSTPYRCLQLAKREGKCETHARINDKKIKKGGIFAWFIRNKSKL